MIDSTVFFACLSIGIIFDFLLFSAMKKLSLVRALLTVVSWLIISYLISFMVTKLGPVGLLMAAIIAPGVGRIIGQLGANADTKSKNYSTAKKYL